MSLTPEQQPAAPHRPTPEQITAAAQLFAAARARRDSLSPEEAARQAYVPGGPSVEEIAALIRELRGEQRAAP